MRLLVLYILSSYYILKISILIVNLGIIIYSVIVRIEKWDIAIK